MLTYRHWSWHVLMFCIGVTKRFYLGFYNNTWVYLCGPRLSSIDFLAKQSSQILQLCRYVFIFELFIFTLRSWSHVIFAWKKQTGSQIGQSIFSSSSVSVLRENLKLEPETEFSSLEIKLASISRHVMLLWSSLGGACFVKPSSQKSFGNLAWVNICASRCWKM